MRKLTFDEIEDVIEECIDNGESLLNLENGIIKYALENSNLFIHGEPGLFVPKVNVIIFNKEWLKIANIEDIRFLTFSLVRNYYQYYVANNNVYEEDEVQLKWFDAFKNLKELKEVLDKDSIEFANTAIEFFYKKYKSFQ